MRWRWPVVRRRASADPSRRAKTGTQLFTASAGEVERSRPPDLIIRHALTPLRLRPLRRGEAGALSAGARSATRERRSPLRPSPRGSSAARWRGDYGCAWATHVRRTDAPVLVSATRITQTEVAAQSGRALSGCAAGRLAPHRRRRSAPPLRLAAPCEGWSALKGPPTAKHII
jgi:hypothetical protein